MPFSTGCRSRVSVHHWMNRMSRVTNTSTTANCSAAVRNDEKWKSSANRHASNPHTISPYATAPDSTSHGHGNPSAENIPPCPSAALPPPHLQPLRRRQRRQSDHEQDHAIQSDHEAGQHVGLHQHIARREQRIHHEIQKRRAAHGLPARKLAGSPRSRASDCARSSSTATPRTTRRAAGSSAAMERHGRTIVARRIRDSRSSTRESGTGSMNGSKPARPGNHDADEPVGAEHRRRTRRLRPSKPTLRPRCSTMIDIQSPHTPRNNALATMPTSAFRMFQIVNPAPSPAITVNGSAHSAPK